MSNSSLAGQRVLVTGASSGIGRAVAVACAEAGATVAGLARRAERLESLSASHGVVPVVGDVTAGGAAGLVATAVEGLGGLDVLVNSAGIARMGLIGETDPADWRAMFDVNVLGLLEVTQAAMPALRADGGGSIVNISSMSGRRIPAAEGGVYSATKFAVHAISEALRMELQESGVRVTTVSPGFVATEIFDDQPDSAVIDRYRTLAKSVGMQVEDVAAAVLHAVTAPASVGTVEIALVPTNQSDEAYRKAVAED
ncbi:SDR family oxidoreductase [Euzebya rosea]|uniref:SDR family oxidoreductase n=1 Tax=Euzebya rosea TaxID=2052804 RepID=UPI0013001E34|nr:SDR family oxidoreductase [Euzebya rosea]